VLLDKAYLLLAVLGIRTMLDKRVVGEWIIRGKVLVVTLPWYALEVLILLVGVDVRLVVLVRFDIRRGLFVAEAWLLQGLRVAVHLLEDPALALVDSLRLLDGLLVLELEALSWSLAQVARSCTSGSSCGL